MLEVNPEEIKNILNTLEDKIGEYDTHIQEFSKLSNLISDSSDWIDESIKPGFVDYLNSYIEIFEAVSSCLSSYKEFLSDKADNFLEHESKFC